MILLYGTILNHSRSASRLPIGEMMWIQGSVVAAQQTIEHGRRLSPVPRLKVHAPVVGLGKLDRRYLRALPRRAGPLDSGDEVLERSDPNVVVPLDRLNLLARAQRAEP